MTGRIVKGVGGFYEVMTEDGVIPCKARGRFRQESLKPMIGDLVEIAVQADGSAAIEKIAPRRNALTRPPVANIDQLVIVVAASNPRPDWLLVDKLLLECAVLGIRPLLALNKLDEPMDDIVETFTTDYAGAFDALYLSSVTGEGLDELRLMLASRVTCLAGQSAVGKSSLLNALIPALSLEVGGLSQKTARGKHTTRHAELFLYAGGAVLDTPGFSFLETGPLEQEALDNCYPEFGDAPSRCRFAGCSHIKEKECAVKELVENGKLSKARYERYCLLAEEMITRRKHRYD